MDHSQHNMFPSIQQGFTLLEVLVVMVLLGIILSVAVIGTGNPQADKLEEDVRRLLQILKLTQEEAILTRQQIAVKFGTQHYELSRYDDEEKIWIPISDPAIFRRRELDPGYEIKLFQDGISVSLEEEDSGRVLFYSSGEMTPFELHLSLPDTDIRYQMTGTMLGELSVEDMHAYGTVVEDPSL
ncbi:MAG: GspH/FimT family pseudopilin [Gammaproteobacteria bacterium]|nr:GspH/FimT family pseudopilin [Gammaproteobacteria bacterium]